MSLAFDYRPKGAMEGRWLMSCALGPEAVFPTHNQPPGPEAHPPSDMNATPDHRETTRRPTSGSQSIECVDCDVSRCRCSCSCPKTR